MVPICPCDSLPCKALKGDLATLAFGLCSLFLKLRIRIIQRLLDVLVEYALIPTPSTSMSSESQIIMKLQQTST